MNVKATCIWLLLLSTTAHAAAVSEICVQDIAHLQGRRTNKLMGYGLVVGLNGTGDGDQYAPTMRALMALHRRYHAPILTAEDISGNQSVALVIVEAEIPEYGAREGQTVDVVVSTLGAASSINGGQLLTTPLQYAMFNPDDESTQAIMALAGGRVIAPDAEIPTRGVVRQGATLEDDFYYWFIQDGAITLVLNDTHAGWTWAHMMARALNHELTNPAAEQFEQAGRPGQQVIDVNPALALGPKNVQVKIPPYEQRDPAGYISRVLQTPLFMKPKQVACVTINRTTETIAFTGNVTVSPTVLQIPGLGTVLIGRKLPAEEGEAAEVEPVDFTELLDTLSAIQASPAQLINAVEQLHKTGTLHAQLAYD